MARLSKFVLESEGYKFIKQAIIISKRVLPLYSSKFSMKKYKQYQLFLLGNIIIIDSTGFSVNYRSFYYDKRLNNFSRKVKKKYVKATTIVDEKSQIIVSFSAHFGEIHDSKEFKKALENMDKEIIGKFKFIIGDKGYDSERGKSRYCQEI